MMDARHFTELVELEDSYWWHVAKRQLVCSVLRAHFPPPARLVEGGIGSARNLVEFRRMGYEVSGLDLMPEAVEHARSRGLQDVLQHDLMQPWPWEPSSRGVIVLLDVLEHTAGPVQVLRHAVRVLQPGGGIVVTVPAYPWLYSGWDRRLGHFRRYTIRTIRSQAQAAGLRVRRLTYWNAFSLPMAVAVRGWDRLFSRDRPPEFPRVSPSLNALLLMCAGQERRWIQRTGLPLGLSIVGVFTK